MLPRGIRNNNPLNIRRTAKDQWKGLRAQQTDASFCQFDSLEYSALYDPSDYQQMGTAPGESDFDVYRERESIDGYSAR